MTADRAEVLRVITRLNIGGPARQALLLTRALQDRHPTVLAAGTPTVAEGELTDAAVPVTRVPLVRPLDPRHDAAALVAIRRLLHRTGAAILHTHMAKAGTLGRLAARTARRVRTVHTFHGHVLEGYFSASVQRAFLAVERRLARGTDVLIAISPEIRDQLLDLGIGRPSQYEVIRLGFDLTAYTDESAGTLRRSLGVDASTPLVGIAGRLVPIKDHETMFDAVGRLPGVHLAVLGDGERRAELEQLTARLGIADRVHFVGWCHDMPAAYADLDVVALTSRNEGTPVALIEALASRRPVVATDVGGVRSVVVPEETGLLAPPGDGAAVAAAIARLLGDTDTGARLAARGRSLVLSTFGQDRLVSEIDALYDSLLAGRTRSSR